MAALPLVLWALTAASVLAEPAVYLREQFEDGGESFSRKPGVMTCRLHAPPSFTEASRWQLKRLLCVLLRAGMVVVFVLVPSAGSLIRGSP